MNCEKQVECSFQTKQWHRLDVQIFFPLFFLSRLYVVIMALKFRIE